MSVTHKSSYFIRRVKIQHGIPETAHTSTLKQPNDKVTVQSRNVCSTLAKTSHSSDFPAFQAEKTLPKVSRAQFYPQGSPGYVRWDGTAAVICAQAAGSRARQQLPENRE